VSIALAGKFKTGEKKEETDTKLNQQLAADSKFGMF